MQNTSRMTENREPLRVLTLKFRTFPYMHLDISRSIMIPMGCEIPYFFKYASVAITIRRDPQKTLGNEIDKILQFVNF
jgi:hypothetical protein